jgi:hypothetical protein
LLDLLLQLADPGLIDVDELVEFLTSLTDAVDCLFHPCHPVGPPSFLFLLKFEKRFDLSAVVHVEFGGGVLKGLGVIS